jgi:hypothetical protein
VLTGSPVFKSLSATILPFGFAAIDPGPRPHWHPAAGIRRIDWISLGIGIFGTIITVAALIYAFRAARDADKAASRAESLLLRLVVLPFRQLDRRHAQLTDDEANLVDAVYEATDHGKSTATRQDIALFTEHKSPPAAVELAFLADNGWIVQNGDRWTFVEDRIPFMQFLSQARFELEQM